MLLAVKSKNVPKGNKTNSVYCSQVQSQKKLSYDGLHIGSHVSITHGKYLYNEGVIKDMITPTSIFGDLCTGAWVQTYDFDKKTDVAVFKKFNDIVAVKI